MSDVTALKSTHIVTPDGIRAGYLLIENGTILGIEDSWSGPATDYGSSYLMPGFVDIHVHGWGRGSFAYKGDHASLVNMSRDLVSSGVTSYLATSGTMPDDFLKSSLAAAAEYLEAATPSDGAEVIGVHMEGPWINPKHLGMQRADCLQSPSIEGFEQFNAQARGHIRLVTLAPELEGSLPFIRYLHGKGITVSAGHTDATFDQITAAIDAGLKHFTHAFSAMRGFHHRELGVVGALMYYPDVYAEVAKQSGITIKPQAFDILYRLKGDRRLVLMSDCMGYADFPEGYEFHHYLRQETFRIRHGKLEITAKNGDCQQVSPDDWPVVSGLEMNFLDSVKNIVGRLEKGLESVAQIACHNPAVLAGVASRKGSLAAGKDADILCLDQALNLTHVWCRGVHQPLPDVR
ncbi:N-acetylglucosamine-6-phosphate deacetylase [Buttiauxella selenatireducens]|uniref:N-acetylglucosamine-6-phosphate deacetylase n=1 Tax=Buttiauxella selenatireducens TaxID=3073902 RepID=A0ABY9SAE4_9ENTR|nr:N-acetylglucosamine-6-phosphate deacetylase [Buttiauxella sp. R73]WMY74489.1 N-acetylglucosamine-6-phosphate deacetylase [Buttiauxella sp. R73]